MSFTRTAHIEAESDSLSSSLLVCGIGIRFAIAAVACALLWLAIFWALT